MDNRNHSVPENLAADLTKAKDTHKKTGKVDAKTVARVAMLAALAAILYYLPGIPIITSIYKLDFSSIPVLVGAVALGPLHGLAILFIKDLTGLLHSSSMGVGELADFLTSGALILAVSLFARGVKIKMFKADRNMLKCVLAMGIGVVCMALVGALANYWILIPFYINVMNMPEAAIVNLIAKAIPSVDSIAEAVLYAAVPFNLFKGLVICAVTLFVTPYIRRVLDK